MRSRGVGVAVMAVGMAAVLAVFDPALVQAQAVGTAQTGTASAQAEDDPVRTLVGRLDLEKYKATIKGLTQFGDRRQGTDRNRAANDWIEAQLKSYGCSDVGADQVRVRAGRPVRRGRAGAAPRLRARRAAELQRQAPQAWRRSRRRPGGGRPGTRPGRRESGQQGNRGPTGVNNDPQQAARRRSCASSTCSRSTPGLREEVYCTKIGSTHPDEMYIVGGHMDGIGYSEGANDNASGAALVMELARIFSAPDVKTDRSIRFVLWNNEETGLNGARAYVEQRGAAAGEGGSARIGQVPGTEVARHDRSTT